MDAVALRTERLELSSPETADVDAIFAACQDPDIQRFTTVPSPYERRHAEGFIPFVHARWENDAEYTWAIRSDGRLAGMIALIRNGEAMAEIGYWMAPDARGRGVVTEAARAVVDWGFAADGGEFARIEWRALAGHVVSARVARSVGFRFEGTLRQGLVSHRGRQDGWLAALLPSDDRTPRPWPVLDD